MLETVKRRLAGLERSIQPPLTAERFWSRLEEHARLTGASFDEALRAEMAKLSAEDFKSVKRGLEEIAFAGNTAALEAFYAEKAAEDNNSGRW
jgi:hypothetical protein